MTKPEFIDNRCGNTMAAALAKLLGTSENGKTSSGGGVSVRIATAFFTPAGYNKIADSLGGTSNVKLLLGVDLAGNEQVGQSTLGEDRNAFEQRALANRLGALDVALRKERDRLPFSRVSHFALRRIVTAVREGRLVVRRYEQNFLHAKAYIFEASEGAEEPQSEGIIAGSSNLTVAGLVSNLELNLGHYDKEIFSRSRQWFDDLWAEAEPYDLQAVFSEPLVPHRPYEIFLRVLWQLYGHEIITEPETERFLPLTSFQKHGVARALRLIESTGGAIVADEVGLGKTFIAGEILDIYRRNRQRALLICPAALRDSTWKSFLNKYQVFAECLSFDELARDKRLRKESSSKVKQKKKLQRPIEEYQLVIIDEAHNYRNPDTPTRAKVLQALLFGLPRDILMLTATPVNNSLWDLYHLIRYFIRQDAHFAEQGIRSMRERFDVAAGTDPSNLSPDQLYPIIDGTTVKRTRQFVKKHYTNDAIRMPDGEMMPIVFPEPKALSVKYGIEDLAVGLFEHVEGALDPDGEHSITFARYMPDKYLLDKLDEEEVGPVHAMVGLLRSGMLKRFESSIYAFRMTVERMCKQHKMFLETLESGWVATTAFLKEISSDADTTLTEVLAEGEAEQDSKLLKPARLYDVDGLSNAVALDLDRLRSLLTESASIPRDHDPKLRALCDELVAIAQQAEREASDRVDEVQRRKVIVFSSYQDTVEWIRDYLRGQVRTRSELAPYENRIIAVSGSDELESISWQEAVHGFAPISSEADTLASHDVYDLLISTDVLAEGVNLQQCRHIINYDMPWNPMRLVQRHGRIDRIGSPHKRVFLRTVFPADRIDRMLNLEAKIMRKLAYAAASVGVRAPIRGALEGAQVFTETREEIEKLLREDPSLFERGGTVGATQTGEEYRQTLRKVLKNDPNYFVHTPWKIGSGMTKGTKRGVFFCAVVGDRTFLRFVHADDDWKIAVPNAPIEREIGTCLRMVECDAGQETWWPEFLQDRVFDFWEVAQQDIWDEWEEATDPLNLQPQVRRLNREVAEFIRDNPPKEVEAQQLQHALDIVESPWSRREENDLREWFADQQYQGASRSQFLVDKILNTGLVPAQPPPPLPPIAKDEIRLLCWLGIEREES